MTVSTLIRAGAGLFVLVCASLLPSTAAPEEGMWTFDNLPLKQLKEKYGFEPSAEWLDHVRLSSIKFEEDGGGGGSASFVSPDGLLMTNHHVAMGTLQRLYNEKKEYDYVTHGFSAKQYGSEVKAPGFKLKQLVAIHNATKAVVDAAAGLEGADRAKARSSTMADLVKQHTDASKRLFAEPVNLYQGSVQNVYVYRTYDDIRLVFAPEKQAAFYGGDLDNFTYPRFCLDVAFFRVYENDKPIDTSKNFFKWSVSGAQKDELIFVPGNPGTTNRLMTYAELEVQRDVIVPSTLTILRDRLAAVDRQMKADPEKGKELRDEYFGLANSLKAYEGHLVGLLDTVQMAKKKAAEEELIAKAGDPAVTEAFAKIGAAQRDFGKIAPRARYYRLPGLIARSNARPTAFQQFVAAVNKGETAWTGDLEITSAGMASLSSQLEASQRGLPKDDAFLKAVLGDKSVEQAVAAFGKSKVLDAAYRSELLKGGAAALAKADDPLLVAVRDVGKIVDEFVALQRKLDELRGPATDLIAQARFKAYGTSLYPDATFTLRLSYGTCKGYEAGTTAVPWRTTFNGLFERNAAFDNEPPFDLPQRWLDARSKIDANASCNFVCTTDIIGGNSGSPIINRNREVVGLVFDGNIESLPGAYWFDEAVNRTVAVHTAGMTEALWRVYGEGELVAELVGR